MKKIKFISIIAALAFCFIGGMPTQTWTASADEIVTEQTDNIDVLPEAEYQMVYNGMLSAWGRGYYI